MIFINYFNEQISWKTNHLIWDEILSGTVIFFDLGYVVSGFWPGAVITEITRSPNPDPQKCFTSTGITKLKTDVSVLTIKNGKEEIACWGMYTDIYSPGINQYWSEKLSIFSLQLKWFKSSFQMLRKWLFKSKKQNLPKRKI